MTTNKGIFSLILFVLPYFAQGWLERRMLSFSYSSCSCSSYQRATRSAIRLSAKEERAAAENPCWQDIYDEDCSMDHAYAASFVASEWLKRMPCGEGIEVCIAKPPSFRNGVVIDCASESFVLCFLNWMLLTSTGLGLRHAGGPEIAWKS